MMMPRDGAAPNQALPRDGSDRPAAAPPDDSPGRHAGGGGDPFPAFREYLLAPKIEELDSDSHLPSKGRARESPARRGAAAARMRRHRSEAAETMDGGRGSARRVPDGYRMRDVPGDGRGGEEERSGSPRGGRSERPSLRKSASERLRLRRMLLEESLDCSMEGDASGAAGNSPPYKPYASTSQQSLRESANENHPQDLRFPKHRSYSGSTSNRRALPTSNEEWPEATRAHEPPRANGRPLSVWESRRRSFDHGANGRAGIHASERRTFDNGRGSLTMGGESLLDGGLHPFNSSVRRSSAPDVGSDHHGRSILADSTNSAGSASLMAEHIALKLKVAELQSELQVTQSQAKKCSVGLQQAEGAMGRLREDNARLSKQNSQLVEENAFLVSLLGPREAERLRKYREGVGLATNAQTKEKRRHSSYQPVRKSRCRSGDTPQPNKDTGAKDAGGKTPQRRRSSWWTKRSSSMPAATLGNSDRDAILQDFPPADDSVPPRRSSSHKSFGETDQSTNPVRRPSEDAATNLTSSLAELTKNIHPKQRLGLEDGGVANERKGPKRPVPEYIQFGGGDEANLRCSDLSLSYRVEKPVGPVGEASNERRIAQHRMSDIDERESKYNGAPAADDACPREKGERAHAASGTATNSGRGGESDVESYWLWRSSGPLAYSATEHAGVGEGGEDGVPKDGDANIEQRGNGGERLPLDEDESWNQSFAYSSVGGKSVDESAANKADAARVEI